MTARGPIFSRARWGVNILYLVVPAHQMAGPLRCSLAIAMALTPQQIEGHWGMQGQYSSVAVSAVGSHHGPASAAASEPCSYSNQGGRRSECAHNTARMETHHFPAVW